MNPESHIESQSSSPAPYRFSTVAVPSGLMQKVFHRIQREQYIHTLRYRIALVAGCGLLSLIALIPAFNNLHQEVIKSGIVQYLSLLLSDPTLLLPYWREFLTLVTETVPMVALVYVLALIVVVLWSTDIFVHDMIEFSKV